MSQQSLARPLSAEAIIERIDALLAQTKSGALAFDGDGTLWSGDVGEEAFLSALDQDLLRGECRAFLAREAQAHGISSQGSVSQIARRLYQAFLDGSYSELSACEMMVLCYAGWTESELRAHTRSTLGLSTSAVRPFAPLLSIVRWARERELRCIVVSASPQLVVEEAAVPLGFSPGDIIAGLPLLNGNRIQPTLARAIPYAATKVTAARSLLADKPWLATFGDNAFDLDMLQAAQLPVLVRPKQRLLDLSRSLTDPVMLADKATD